MERIKEKPPVRVFMREKGKAAPKELARQALQHAVGQTRQQLREAAQGGEAQDEYGTDATLDRVMDAAVSRLSQPAVPPLRRKEQGCEQNAAHTSGDSSIPQQDRLWEEDADAVHQAPERGNPRPKIKTKDVYLSHQTDTPIEPIQSTPPAAEQMRQAAVERLKIHRELCTESNPPLDLSEPSQVPLRSRPTIAV